MSATRTTITLALDLTEEEAWALAQAIKRINRRNLAGDSIARASLGISTAEEEPHAERAFIVLANRLGEKGYLPR